jgi:hypothetical protein
MNSQMKTVGVIALIVVAGGLLLVSLKSTLFSGGPAKATPEQGKAMAEAMRKSAEDRQKAGPAGMPGNMKTGGDTSTPEAPK